jgi:hypothetical protein
MKEVMNIKDNTSDIIYKYLKTVEWKPVVYEDVKPGMYEVSNYGFIRNVHTGRTMSICFSEKGYAMVELATISGRGKSKKLHRIVARHFVDGETKRKCEVDHLDGNKRNNQASNLEWVTHLENIRRAYKHNLIPIKSCDGHPNATIRNEDVHEICKALIRHNGDCRKVLNEVQDHIDCTLRLIHRIKYKSGWNAISDLYFNKNYFRNLKGSTTIETNSII